MRKPASRKALYGWLFFTPPVFVIISVLACEAYLNIETRKNDYEVSKLKQQADTLNDALAKLRGSSAASQQLQKLQEQALAMGLRDPEPWQIERVDMAAPLLPASAFEIARVIPAPPVMPKRHEPEVVAVPAPAPAADPAPETIAPFAPMDGNAVLATAPEPIELELLEQMPVQNEHVAQLEESLPKEERVEEMVAPSRAPLAAPLASPSYDLPPATVSTAPIMQEASTPGSLDESVESMLAL
jgi:hypothetical protein